MKTFTHITPKFGLITGLKDATICGYGPCCNEKKCRSLYDNIDAYCSGQQLLVRSRDAFPGEPDHLRCPCKVSQDHERMIQFADAVILEE